MFECTLYPGSSLWLTLFSVLSPVAPVMIVTVKALQGEEARLQVSQEDRISTVKKLVAEKLQVPVGQQRLLYKGKALADEQRLSDYSIGPDSKLNLVVKLTERPSPEEPPKGMSPQPRGVWFLLSQVLARHFSTSDAEKILEYLQKDYERSLRLLSLDDIERLATRLLHPQMLEAMEMGFLD